MTNLEIYKLAWMELLRRIEAESKRLEKNPDSQISAHLLDKLNKQERELHNLIITEEKAI